MVFFFTEDDWGRKEARLKGTWLFPARLKLMESLGTTRDDTQLL
jgi:hypothetical protein